MSTRADQNNFKIPLFKVFMSEDVINATSNVLLSGKISQYNKVTEFEKILSDYIGNYKLITVNAGTNALHLAYHLLKKEIKELNYPGWTNGDEVLTTSLTCVATNWPILANSLNIKWVDIDPNNLNLDIEDLKNKLSPKTKIICVVHWGGTPNNLDKLKDVQNYCLDKYGFKPIIIEDCAHSFGAEYNGKKLGNHGNIVMYSFQAIKHLTTIDGGLLVLPTKELYERAKLVRWFGISRERKNKQKDFRVEDDVKEFGFKFHMNDVNATVGINNFPHVIENIKIHRDNGKYYTKELSKIPCVTLLKTNEKINSSYWLYTFKIKNRDDFIPFMRNKGICVSQVHGRNDVHTCVKKYQIELPLLDKVEKDIICIPVGFWVTNKDREYIIKCIKEWNELVI